MTTDHLSRLSVLQNKGIRVVSYADLADAIAAKKGLGDALVPHLGRTVAVNFCALVPPKVRKPSFTRVSLISLGRDKGASKISCSDNLVSYCKVCTGIDFVPSTVIPERRIVHVSFIFSFTRIGRC